MGRSGRVGGSGGEQPFPEARHVDSGEPGAGRRFRCRAGPQRRAVRPAGPDDPARQAGRTAAHDRHAADAGRLVLPRAHRLPVAPPPAFPPWRTVYGYRRAVADADVGETIRHHLVMMLRERDGREPSPTAAILDTQSVKTTEKGALAATTRPRGSRAASGTSRSAPRACCRA